MSLSSDLGNLREQAAKLRDLIDKADETGFGRLEKLLDDAAIIADDVIRLIDVVEVSVEKAIEAEQARAD